MYSADLLGCSARVDYSFYMPRGNVSISGKRYGSTEYFTEYCVDEDDIKYYRDTSNCSNIYFYGNTSGERSFAKNKLDVETGLISWADSRAISQPEDSGCPIFFALDEIGGDGYALIAIMSTSNANSGGEGQTIYSIINDIEYNTDYMFDDFCTD